MKHFFIPLLCIGAAFVLHSMVQTHLVSPFSAPLSIPVLLATAIPLPAFLIVGIVVLFELLSSFPQGSMVLVFLIPFFTRWLIRWNIPDTSWKFFAYVGITVSLQVLALLGIGLLSHHGGIYQIPFSLALLQIVGTSVSTFVLALICNEVRTRP